LVQTDEERKAWQKEYDSRPKVIAHKKELESSSKNKAKRKERRARPENKAKQKEYDSRPENKAKQKKRDIKYRLNPENIAKRKERESTPENIAKRKERRARPENKAKVKKYMNKPKVKAKAQERKASPPYRKKAKEYRRGIRLEVLKYYSKHLSNSDIPCCNCCGLNSHIGFLALDHIGGKRQMDSDPELVVLGYSSDKNPDTLLKWIIDNNFPKGFQILCHNCNVAKRDYGSCPLENKPH